MIKTVKSYELFFRLSTSIHNNFVSSFHYHCHLQNDETRGYQIYPAPDPQPPAPWPHFFLTFITFLHFLNLMQANLLFASLSTQVRRLKKNNSVSPIPLNLRDSPEGHLEPSGTSTMNLFYKKKLTAESTQLTKKLHRICLSGF